MPPSPQTAKLTSTLHLLIPRLRLLQKKSTASSVVQRRELAQLLESNRDASARIRVENVIATDIAVEVMEMVELYCELLLARAGVLDGLAFGDAGGRMRGRVREEIGLLNAKERERSGGGGEVGAEGGETKGGGGGGGGFFRIFGSGISKPSTAPPRQQHPTTPNPKNHLAVGEDPCYLDPALDEASTAIFYAWSRFPAEVRELTMLRSLLADRYGKDFMALASENKLADVKVPERLAKGLRVRPPSAELVESYLREIARAYKISWGDSHLDDIDHEEGGDGGSGGGDLGLDIGDQKDGSERTELTRATPPRGVHAHQLSGKSPVSIAPPGPRSDNPNPRVKVPGDNNNNNNNDDSAEMGSPSPSQRGRDRSGGIPELDELTRRFAALKR